MLSKYCQNHDYDGRSGWLKNKQTTDSEGLILSGLIPAQINL